MQGPQDTSFYSMRVAVQSAIETIKKDPAIANVMGFTGGQGATNGGFTFVALKPLEQRKGQSVFDVINRLRGPLSKIPGAQTFLQPVQDIRIGGRQSSAQYQYTLEAETTAQLQLYGPQPAGRHEEGPGHRRRQLRPAEQRPPGPFDL